MEHIKKIAIGALMLALGGVLFTILVSFLFPLVGITLKPVSNDWVAVIGFIGGIIVFFLYIIFYNQDRNEKKMDSNEKRMEVIGKSYTEIKNSIESLRTPTDKDNEQDDRLNKLESGLSSVKQQVSQYKTHIDTRFDDLKMFLEKYLK